MTDHQLREIERLIAQGHSLSAAVGASLVAEIHRLKALLDDNFGGK